MKMLPSLLESYHTLLKTPSLLLFALYFLVSFATQLLEIPLIRLFENAICKRHYAQFFLNDIDEVLCKIPTVQDQLNDVIGWKMCFDAIPGDSNPPSMIRYR